MRQTTPSPLRRAAEVRRVVDAPVAFVAGHLRIRTEGTRADDLANIGGGIDFLTLKPIKPISVRVYGDNAVARVKLRFKVVAHGQTVQHGGWTTDLFERRDGRWQVVWSQSTAIPNHLDLFIKSLQP